MAPWLYTHTLTYKLNKSFTKQHISLLCDTLQYFLFNLFYFFKKLVMTY